MSPEHERTDSFTEDGSLPAHQDPRHEQNIHCLKTSINQQEFHRTPIEQMAGPLRKEVESEPDEEPELPCTLERFHLQQVK